MTKDKIEIAALKQRNVIEKGYVHSFIIGALSPEAKEYWQHGMYSEEEVLRLFELFKIEFAWHRNIQILNHEFLAWFEQNIMLSNNKEKKI